MVTTTPRRFRFGLRTLFLVVTVICVWLGYQMNWIRQRHEALRDDRVIVMPAKNINPPENEPLAPSGLWLLGEEGRWGIAIASNDRELIERTMRLFPEAGQINAD